jgi:hypothetical protein
MAGALFMAIGCDNKPVPPVQTASTSTTSGSVTPGYNYKVPQQIMTPDTVETRLGTLKFVDGLPTKETAQKMYDNLDFQRGVSVFLDFVPAASLEAMRRGQIEMKATNANQVVIFDHLLDSAPLFLTGNADTVYASAILDLERDGSTVVEIPLGCGPGTVNDAFFRFVIDMGAPGPERGKGGKYRRGVDISGFNLEQLQESQSSTGGYRITRSLKLQLTSRHHALRLPAYATTNPLPLDAQSVCVNATCASS